MSQDIESKKRAARLAAERMGHKLSPKWVRRSVFEEENSFCVACGSLATIRPDGKGAPWTIGGGALYRACSKRPGLLRRIIGGN